MTRFQRVLVLCLSLLLASLPQVASHAAVSPQGIRMFIDGRLIRLNPAPLIVAGRVMVPLRGTVEAMGATVSFLKPRTIVILRDPRVIELELGNRLARVNGTPVRIDVPPIAVAGHTYIPVRFVGEALGAAIRFDRSARSVHIFTSPIPEESLPAPQPVPEAQPAPLPVPFPPPADTQPFPRAAAFTPGASDCHLPASRDVGGKSGRSAGHGSGSDSRARFGYRSAGWHSYRLH